MKRFLLFVGIFSLMGCQDVLEEMNPEYRTRQEAKRKEAWEGPCREVAVKKEKLIHVTCTNKDHRVVVEGDLVICKCPERTENTEEKKEKTDG